MANKKTLLQARKDLRFGEWKKWLEATDAGKHEILAKKAQSEEMRIFHQEKAEKLRKMAEQDEIELKAMQEKLAAEEQEQAAKEADELYYEALKAGPTFTNKVYRFLRFIARSINTGLLWLLSWAPWLQVVVSVLGIIALFVYSAQFGFFIQPILGVIIAAVLFVITFLVKADTGKGSLLQTFASLFGIAAFAGFMWWSSTSVLIARKSYAGVHVRDGKIVEVYKPDNGLFEINAPQYGDQFYWYAEWDKFSIDYMADVPTDHPNNLLLQINIEGEPSHLIFTYIIALNHDKVSELSIDKTDKDYFTGIQEQVKNYLNSARVKSTNSDKITLKQLESDLLKIAISPYEVSSVSLTAFQKSTSDYFRYSKTLPKDHPDNLMMRPEFNGVRGELDVSYQVEIIPEQIVGLDRTVSDQQHFRSIYNKAKEVVKQIDDNKEIGISLEGAKEKMLEISSGPYRVSKVKIVFKPETITLE